MAKRTQLRHKIFQCIRRTIQQFDAGLHQGPGELACTLDNRISDILDQDDEPDEGDSEAEDAEYQFDAEEEEDEE